jgi:UDP-N-acetylmuramyl tripeptide synthase
VAASIELLDARRLTGPNILFDEPGTILDVACGEADAARLAPLWERHARRAVAGLGWSAGREYTTLALQGGMSLGFTAPIDALYTAVAASEWAFAAALAELAGAAAADLASALEELRPALADEANPALLEMQAAAAARGATLLWDDDEVSLGMGRRSLTFPARELPGPGTLDWGAFADVPVAIVTGTNGKTTTVRLAAHIARGAWPGVGISSTDYIAVDDRIVDRDDWAGPGGARIVLRDHAVECAILETARGGLLRRGLGVCKANAALITNVARDHLGDFGSRNVDELLRCKWIVSRAVRESGKLILNADDPRLVNQARGYTGELVWFSLAADNEILRAHVRAGGVAFALDGDILQCIDGGNRIPICRDAEVPITLGGAARHNVANALAAAALTWSLGVGPETIRAGLTTMAIADNPGRGNVYDVAGATLLVDFAHNPRALHALLDTASRLPAARKALCFGQAGDRPDDLIRELARGAWESGLDRVWVSELPKYRRGRGPGEVYAVIRDELLASGARPDQVEHREHEIDSFEAALAWARPGDLILMLALERAPELFDRLRKIASL